MTAKTRFLSKLLGLYLVLMSLSLFLRPHEFVSTMKSIIQDPPLLFVAGILAVVAGLAIVLQHNIWHGGALPIIITLAGWTVLIKGALILFLTPDQESRVFIVAIHFAEYPYVFAAGLLILGAYLTYSGFTTSAGTLPA